MTKLFRMRGTKLALGAALAGGALLVLGVGGRSAKADLNDPDFRTRCATRVSIALTGGSPDATLLAAANPQDAVDQLMTSAAFRDRFARFINYKFNDGPGASPQLDPAYFYAAHIIRNTLPWAEMFTGNYQLTDNTGADDDADPTDDFIPTARTDGNGLGYFRTQPWLIRYAGNELTGLKIVAANRMLQNMLGIKFTAVTNAPGADVSATGRKQQPCAGCHYEGPFALDRTSSPRPVFFPDVT